MSKIEEKYKNTKRCIKKRWWKFNISGPKGSKKLSINDKIFAPKLTEDEFNIPLKKT